MKIPWTIRTETRKRMAGLHELFEQKRVVALEASRQLRQAEKALEQANKEVESVRAQYAEYFDFLAQDENAGTNDGIIKPTHL